MMAKVAKAKHQTRRKKFSLRIRSILPDRKQRLKLPRPSMKKPNMQQK